MHLFILRSNHTRRLPVKYVDESSLYESLYVYVFMFIRDNTEGSNERRNKPTNKKTYFKHIARMNKKLTDSIMQVFII